MLWDYFKLHEATECGCCAFINNTLEDTWIRKLRHTKTIYSNVNTRALMDNTQLHCKGLHVLEVVNLTSMMITYYSDSAAFHKYINIIEETRKNAQRVKLSIPNVTLVEIATK